MAHHHRENRDNRGRRSTQLSDLDPALTDLSRRTIGCAIEVHKELGPGYPLEIYLNALKIEFKHEKIDAQYDKKYELDYDDDILGHVTADLVIGDRFIVALLAEDRDVTGQERTALRAVLRAADLELGLIINFGQRRLKDGLVRVLNPDALRADDDDDEEYEDDDEETDAED